MNILKNREPLIFEYEVRLRRAITIPMLYSDHCQAKKISTWLNLFNLENLLIQCHLITSSIYHCLFQTFKS